MTPKGIAGSGKVTVSIIRTGRNVVHNVREIRVMSEINHKKINIATRTCIIFLSVIFMLLSAAYYVFNTVTIRELGLDKSAFASSEIEFEKLGFSDIAVAKFLSAIQELTSPEESKILTNSPRKNITDQLLYKNLDGSSLAESNLSDILFSTVFFEGKKQVEISDKELCFILDSVFAKAETEQYNKISKISGANAVSVKNIIIEKDDDGDITAELAFFVNVSNIRDRVLHNLGQSMFQIGDKMYFSAFFTLTADPLTGMLSGERQKVTLYNMDEELSEKFIRAIFISYSLDYDNPEILFSHHELADEIFDVFLTLTNNLGYVGIYDEDAKQPAFVYGNAAISDNTVNFKTRQRFTAAKSN